MRTIRPVAALSAFVRDFMLVEVAEETTRLRMPELGLVLGVRYRGEASFITGSTSERLPNLTLAGMTDTARQMSTAAGSGVLLARFTPAGAACFFAEPLHELFGAATSLDAFVPQSSINALSESVRHATGDGERVAALEAFLLARLLPRAPDPLAVEAVRVIEQTRGSVPIRVLARQLAISLDPLEKRFRTAVGTSPKHFASLVRLNGALRDFKAGRSLAQLSVQAGYFDESHFHREFRAVTGLAPGRFFRAMKSKGLVT